LQTLWEQIARFDLNNDRHAKSEKERTKHENFVCRYLFTPPCF
jgi:hypothetical protein